MKRLFDIFSSLALLLLVLPFFLVIGLWIVFDSRGGIFYRQVRVGKGGKLFKLLKFRTMHPNNDIVKITVGDRDPRVTRAGFFLRKYKLDELPQLLNILKGDMSVVGPRPEVPEYVELYSEDQRIVFSVRPGLTDYATLEYVDESQQLAQAEDPYKMYIEEIMPTKLNLNLKYIREKSIGVDLKIIFRTILRIIR
ncbi:MAG TPA: glycosyl transferase [Flavobacteriales bacterium]|nr:glycosyl transferase [Flavobacteriales bacterium]